MAKERGGRESEIFGVTGQTNYPHEKHQGFMSTEGFPDGDELETGEVPKGLRRPFLDRHTVDFPEDKIIEQIDAERSGRNGTGKSLNDPYANLAAKHNVPEDFNTPDTLEEMKENEHHVGDNLPLTNRNAKSPSIKVRGKVDRSKQKRSRINFTRKG